MRYSAVGSTQCCIRLTRWLRLSSEAEPGSSTGFKKGIGTRAGRQLSIEHFRCAAATANLYADEAPLTHVKLFLRIIRPLMKSAFAKGRRFRVLFAPLFFVLVQVGRLIRHRRLFLKFRPSRSRFIRYS